MPRLFDTLQVEPASKSRRNVAFVRRTPVCPFGFTIQQDTEVPPSHSLTSVFARPLFRYEQCSLLGVRRLRYVQTNQNCVVAGVQPDGDPVALPAVDVCG